MSSTVTISGIGGHVANGVQADKPEGMSIDDAIYHTVHRYPGGVAALAARMGVSVGTLTHKANPNNTTHHMAPRELVAMQSLSGDVSVLHAMAAALGYSCTKAVPDQAQGNAMEAFLRLTQAFGDYLGAVADPIRRMELDAAVWVSPAELRRADYKAGMLHAEVDHMLATMRAHQRPAPKVEG